MLLEDVVQTLKDAYDKLDPVWLEDTSSFLALMIVDGCFILEILRMNHHIFDDYAPNDPIFSNDGMLYILPFLRRDMLLLENQVPLLVLFRLIEVEKRTPDQPDEYLNKLVLGFFHSGPYPRNVGRCLHLLDIYRKSLLQESPMRNTARFLRRRRRHPFNPIEASGDYCGNETKSRLLNLIAFERFDIGDGNEVTSYVFFLTSLIKGSQDVSLLRSCGIISNALGTDEDVAEIFNLLRRDVVVDPESRLDMVYRVVSRKLRNRFRKRLYEWRADLVRTYFRSPWAAISVFAAILLFTLTIIQTVYSVLSYNYQK
ncbi:hypothetical protein Salat_1272100 [Sesamum alatum]|uniref:Uncharacterized protein n=1 Tax=Sesamum alatum TaxID=300844 RepID=A0AAE1YG80_9LAMI|nr:hypothetical protein Salat_1272100 [Sesamum alatum]